MSNCINTKFVSRWGPLIVELAIKAVKLIQNDGNKNIDTKR